MPVFIKYEYQIAGENDIKRSMSSVAAHAEKENNRVVRSQTRARQTSMGAANSNASIREAEKAELARAKAAERADKKAAATAIREHDRAEKEKTKATAREARERSRIEEDWGRKQRQLKDQHNREIFRRQIDEERAAVRHRASLYNTTRGVVGGTASRVTGIARGASLVAGVGGVALATNAVHEGMKVERSAAGLANQMAVAGETPEQIAKRTAAITKQVDAIKGASSAEAIGGAREFGGISGNYELGLKMVQDLAQISLATDVDLASISKVAGGAYMKLKTPDMSEEEAQKQTLEAVRTFAGQGNIGAVEIKDLAQYGNRLTAGAAKFEGSRLQNMKRMGALAQVAVGSGSATDAAEATEAAVRFADDLTQHSDRVEKLTIKGKKVNPFTDASKTKLRGIKELIGDVVEATGGSLPAMQDIFGIRSAKMTEAFASKYNEAELANAKLPIGARQEKGKAGRAAIEAEFEKFDKAALTEKDQLMRAEAALATTTGQLDEAMKRMNVMLAHELMPVMPGLIRGFSDLAKPLAEIMRQAGVLAGWMASNPFAGLAALISAAFLAELTQAKIGSVIKQAFLESGGVGPGAAGKGIGGAAGVTSALAVGVATFSVASAVLNILDASLSEGGQRAGQSIVSQWEEFGKKREEILSGEGTQAEKGAKIEQLATSARKNVALTAESIPSVVPESVTKILGSISSLGAANPFGAMANVAMATIGTLEGGSTEEARKGAAEFDKQLAAEQMKAAKMMQMAAEKVAAGSNSSSSGAMPNRGNSPSPVKG